jgi:NAD(P)-dependent dehydrogenase (short-subunit alcohol dehydrogenase family)
MSLSRSDLVVLTTGANSGIGLATVIEIARRGYRSIGSVRSEAKAETVAKAAADAGVEVETVLMDVNDVEAVERVMSGLRLYGLVNNAGYGLTGAVEDVTDEEARDLLETMVVGPMRLARLALPHMREQGEGRIVNVSSIMGRTATPLTGWYQGAKHALEAITDALRVEVAAAGVRVVLVEPGGFRTSIWADFERDMEKRGATRYRPSYDRLQQMLKLSEPFMGNPEQVAKVIAGCLDGRPRARYLVGMDAQAAALTDRVTPTAVKDLVFRYTLGMPRS